MELRVFTEPQQGATYDDLLRLALAVIILLVALRMALGLAWRPDEIYSIEYL